MYSEKEYVPQGLEEEVEVVVGAWEKQWHGKDPPLSSAAWGKRQEPWSTTDQHRMCK